MVAPILVGGRLENIKNFKDLIAVQNPLFEFN
jgi:hypothetical protein